MSINEITNMKNGKVQVKCYNYLKRWRAWNLFCILNIQQEEISIHCEPPSMTNKHPTDSTKYIEGSLPMGHLSHRNHESRSFEKTPYKRAHYAKSARNVYKKSHIIHVWVP